MHRHARAISLTLAAVLTASALARQEPPASAHPLPPSTPPQLPPAVELTPAAAPAELPAGGKPAKPARANTRPKLNDAQEERVRSARLQTFLARANFSPGLIDGKPGRKTTLALDEYTRAHGINTPGPATDDAVLASLGVHEQWTRTCRITDADATLVTGPIPTDWNERAALAVSGYESLQELLAERGWCSQETVAWLNPGVKMAELKPGDEVVIPDVPDALAPGSRAALPRPASVEVELSARIVRGLDDAGVTLFLLHCSIARDVEKRPVGELHVKVVATDPEYSFDPKDWPEVQGVVSKLRIAPGPRCPVGSAWVGLDLPGYGVHGTVRPQDIGKTGSHGCFRLANWDALRLARAVKIGTPVLVKE